VQISHPDLDQIGQRFEAHAALQHANEAVAGEAHLFTRLHQSLNRIRHAFIVRLAECLEALITPVGFPPGAPPDTFRIARNPGVAVESTLRSLLITNRG
jgi:hypothetical protein